MFRVFDRVTQAIIVGEISVSLGEKLGSSDAYCPVYLDLLTDYENIFRFYIVT